MEEWLAYLYCSPCFPQKGVRFTDVRKCSKVEIPMANKLNIVGSLDHRFSAFAQCRLFTLNQNTLVKNQNYCLNSFS